MAAPVSTPVASNWIAFATIDPTPTQNSIPIPTAECVSICSFPDDIRVVLLRMCDINTVGMLAFTCKTLYEQVLNQTILSSQQLSEICSILLYHQNLTSIQEFCKKILSQSKDRSVDLIISNPWQELVLAVTTIGSCIPISSLTLHGKKIKYYDISTAFEICSRFSVKKLMLTHCIFLKRLENLPVSAAIEEIQFRYCTTQNYRNTKFYLERLPSLKRFIVQDNIPQGGNRFDLVFSSYPCSQIEYIDRQHVNNPYTNWKSFVSRDTIGDDPQNGVSMYLEAYYGVYPSLRIDEDDFINGIFLGYRAQQTADEDNIKNIIEKLRKSIEASPRFVHSKVLLGQLIANKQPQEAENLFRESIEIYPEGIPARASLGMLLLQTGRKEEGVACLEQSASMCEHPSTHVYLVQIIQALIKYKPSVCFLLLKQLIRKTSCGPILRQLKDKIGYHLALIKFAALKPLKQAEICSLLKEKLLQGKNDDFVRLVSMQRYNNQDLFTEIEPWFHIFQLLKDSGKSPMQLLDNFLIVGFQIPKGMLNLFKFLSRPEWKEERQLFLRHISETGNLSFIGNRYDLQFLQTEPDKLSFKESEFLWLPQAEDQKCYPAVEELCKVVLDIGNDYTHYVFVNQLTISESFQIKKELYYNRLRLDADRCYPLRILPRDLLE